MNADLLSKLEPILITGGSGTIGRALVERFTTINPDVKITVFSRDPIKQANMKRVFPSLKFVLGDVRDYDAVYSTTIGHNTVIHAAAQKHIPQAEANPAHCIETNVNGSLNVAQAAIRAGVSRLVGISTDKACYPINTYGHTKALMEKIFLDAAKWPECQTAVTLCRYGNVLGSNGSVLQYWDLFRANGNPLPVTDPHMTRFWMSERQAVDTICQALFIPSGGIVVPPVGALSIAQLAKFFSPHSEIDIVGKRPGERMNEVLITSEESPYVAIEENNGIQWNYICPVVIDETADYLSMRSDGVRTISKMEFDQLMREV